MTPPPAIPPATAEWFYADARQQQQGPVEHDTLLALFRQGQLRRESLVWKAGMSTWQPLHEVLALPAPDSGNARPGSADMATTAAPTPAPKALQPPPPPAAIAPMPPAKKNKGCLIALVVALVLGLVAIPVIGILAAIALPAYQDHTLRAKIANTIASLQPYQQSVAAFYAEHGRCPDNGEADIPERDAFIEPNITDVYVGIDTDEDQYECIIAPTLTGFGNSALDEAELWWAYDADSGEWLCGSTAPDRVLPSVCQG